MDTLFSTGAPIPPEILSIGLLPGVIDLSRTAQPNEVSALKRHQARPAWRLARRIALAWHAPQRGLGLRSHMPQGEPSWVEDPPPTLPGPVPPSEMPPERGPDVTEPPVPPEQPPIQEPPASPGEIVAVAFRAPWVPLATQRRALARAQPSRRAVCHSRALLPQQGQCLCHIPFTTFRIPT